MSDPAAREEEHALVLRAKAGDRAALGALLRTHGPSLYRSVLLPRLGQEAAAKEALAETYAKVVERLHQFNWQGVGFYPWIRTIALRVAIDQLRARRRVVLFSADAIEEEMDASHEVPGADSALGEARDRDAARIRVERALSQIHPRYAEAIRLRILEERPRPDVAALLGVTPATFDVLLHRAIASMKKVLDTTSPSHAKGSDA